MCGWISLRLSVNIKDGITGGWVELMSWDCLLCLGDRGGESSVVKKRWNIISSSLSPSVLFLELGQEADKRQKETGA